MYKNMRELKDKVSHLYGAEIESIAPPIQTTEGIPQVVILKGSNHEMGKQYGEKFAFKIHALITVLKAAVYQTHGEEKVIRDMKTQEYFADKYDPKFREWLEGIQEGCANKGVEISYLDVMLMAVYPGERWSFPGGAYPEELGFDNNAGSNTPHPYCNGFAASGSATVDGKPVVGVSGSPSDETPDRVILLAYPDDGPYYTAFGTIGKPHCQTGMNSAGFAWAFTANFPDPNCDWGLYPEIPCHYLTQCCTSPEEAKKWLEEIPRIGATGNFITTDVEGNISVAESNSDYYNVRLPGDGGERGNYVVATNHFAAEDTLKWNLPEYEEWINDSKCRFATVSEFLAKGVEKGGIDIDYIREIIRSDDWFDPNTGEWHYNEPGSNKGYNLLEYTHQDFLFPADMTAYYMQGNGSGTGVPAGSMGEFVKIPILEDPNDICEAMKMETLFVFFYQARSAYRKTLNANKDLQRDFANQMAFESMLDNAYKAYECGANRAAYAYMCKHEGGSETEYLDLMGEALSYLSKSQLYSKRLVAQLKFYE